MIYILEKTIRMHKKFLAKNAKIRYLGKYFVGVLNSKKKQIYFKL